MYCTNCGKTTEALTDRALAFVRYVGNPVRPADVAERFGVTPQAASAALGHLVARGEIVRVRHGLYSADAELARRALLEQLERLTPA